ncbi:DUF2889 domain-containing protein [Bradyrhizobium cenepequi]|uniref:DUF2889 domain-containing protein n=1 Tax=Bradyrhizobium cenepequi TaxID=2821403 RepID=UPI001CE253C5|nr:DUF2889 domain-containing protein [Bradyrhizobium cenepequi]MCA6112609.1 DUF2889 domain-containing protein [Bradyrhizobium cenepequi]
MPLPAPVEREVLHRRTIEVVGYRRRDQLWDIEAHLVDVKANTYANAWRGEVLPGDPVHDMSLRLTVDANFKICALDVASDKNPYPTCSEATSAFAQLVGLTIGPGWKKTVKEHVGRAAGCIHLAELLGPIGSVMFQTILPFLYDKGTFDKQPRPGLIDSCYAYRRGGDVVRYLWPNLPAE